MDGVLTCTFYLFDLFRKNRLYVNFTRCIVAFQEMKRIKTEHPDDACAVVNDRVKGSLKVTRAFGAGFLKQVDWILCFLDFNRNNLKLFWILFCARGKKLIPQMVVKGSEACAPNS